MLPHFTKNPWPFSIEGDESNHIVPSREAYLVDWVKPQAPDQNSLSLVLWRKSYATHAWALSEGRRDAVASKYTVKRIFPSDGRECCAVIWTMTFALVGGDHKSKYDAIEAKDQGRVWRVCRGLSPVLCQSYEPSWSGMDVSFWTTNLDNMTDLLYWTRRGLAMGRKLPCLGEPQRGSSTSESIRM